MGPCLRRGGVGRGRPPGPCGRAEEDPVAARFPSRRALPRGGRRGPPIWSRDLLASVSLLALGVQSVKFLLPKSSRDGWQLCAVALLEFLAAAAVSDSVLFAPLAFLFFVASAGAMGALHDQGAEEAGRPAGLYAIPARMAAATLLAAGFAGFLVSAFLFAAIPRLEFRRVLQRFSRTPPSVGFSDRITLGEVTGAKSDRRVAVRVEFPELPPGIVPDALYLRGAVYSRYEGDGWRHGGGGASPVPRAGSQYLVGKPSFTDSAADILLGASSHSALFTYGEAVLLEGSLGPVLSDAEGNLSLSLPGHPAIRYRLRFTAVPPPGKGRAPAPGDEYLAFPDGYDEIRKLAAGIVGGAGSDAERASRILRFFRSGFRYTLTDPASSVRDFLFRKRAGHCEHFAAGAALLLRAAGIPSRVSAGYLGGEWNGVGKYLIVRQSDAHAWAEAWVDGRWITFDATPPLGPASPFFARTGMLGLYADWARQRWDKYVVNYSLRTQADLAAGGLRAVRRTGAAFRIGRWEGIGPAARSAAGLVLAGAPVFYLLLRRFTRRTGTGAEDSPPVRPRLPRSYARLVRRLEKAGFRRGPGDSLEESLAAAVRSRPALSGAAARFLDLYHRDRFGPGPIPLEDREEAFLLADRLRLGISDGEAA